MNIRINRNFLPIICAICILSTTPGSFLSATPQKRKTSQTAQRRLVNSFLLNLSRGSKVSNFFCDDRETKGLLKLKRWTVTSEGDLVDYEHIKKIEAKVDYITKEGKKCNGEWIFLVNKKENSEETYCVDLYFEVEQHCISPQ